MALPTLDLTSQGISVSVGATASYEPRFLSSGIGEAPMNRGPDGINENQAEWAVTFEYLTAEQKAYVETFFRERKGYHAFWWKPPEAVSPRKFICSEWGTKAVTHIHFTIDATLKQVFDNA